MNVRRWASLALGGLVGVVASGCGGSSALSDGRGSGPAPGRAPLCTEVAEAAAFEPPTYASETLSFDFVSRGVRADMVVPPFEFEVTVEEDLGAPVSMEFTIYDPNGEARSQRFSYQNMEEACDPICLPVGNTPCPPRRCRMRRTRPRPQRIDHVVYRDAVPGRWTFVLRRLDNDERTSTTLRLFEGEAIEGASAAGEACEALPMQVGDFRRADCREGAVPMGTANRHWGLKGQYLYGGCRANVFALRLSESTRNLFIEGPYQAAPERSFPDGTVHEVEVDGAKVRAWMSHHHLYIVAGRDDLPGRDEMLGAFLRIFPVVGGPDREIPSCDETGAVTEVTVAPMILSELGGRGAAFRLHFEGNIPSGVRVTFPDTHPFAAFGMRPSEIIYAVNGQRIHDRSELADSLRALIAVGTMEIVVGRERVRHPRCLRLTIEEPLAVFADADANSDPDPDPDPVLRAPPPLPPPPPAPPRSGRHCERRAGQCWDCVDIPWPAEVGCGRRCPRGSLCVGLGGRDQCLESTRVCCRDGEPCEMPPGCDGAASSCATTEAGGRNERCTFLNECAQPLPGG